MGHRSARRPCSLCGEVRGRFLYQSILMCEPCKEIIVSEEGVAYLQARNKYMLLNEPDGFMSPEEYVGIQVMLNEGNIDNG